ncbi:hypothetical protein BURK2_03179 [Burkholderiales bacterium]|nr:hypothetical protein BURK2_03179 [Burkholderiales bacterium]
MQRLRFMALAILTALGMIAAGARAQAPELLGYQGVLTLSDGTVVPDGTYTLVFAVYDAASNGNKSFEQQVQVSVKDGLYNIILSSQPGYSLANAFSGWPRYMDVRITAVPEGSALSPPIALSPRQEVASVPFAMSAGKSPVPTAAAAGACYTRWGADLQASSVCATGFTAVVKGRSGGFESFSNGSGAAPPPECISENATAQSGPSEFTNVRARLMRSTSTGHGMQNVDGTCAICCSGGCYVAMGDASCASGYERVYGGRIGGVEAVSYYGYPGSGWFTHTQCIDQDAPAAYSWDGVGGNDARLFRHRPPRTDGQPQGVEQVDSVCSVCCKR